MRAQWGGTLSCRRDRMIEVCEIDKLMRADPHMEIERQICVEELQAGHSMTKKVSPALYSEYSVTE